MVHSITCILCNVLTNQSPLLASNAVHRFGQSLVSSIVRLSSQSTFSSDPRIGDVGVLVFSILLEERHSVAPPDALLHLDITVAAYMALCRISGPDGKSCQTVVVGISTNT